MIVLAIPEEVSDFTGGQSRSRDPRRLRLYHRLGLSMASQVFKTLARHPIGHRDSPVTKTL